MDYLWPMEKELKNVVYEFKTESKWGFTQSEMNTLLKDYPECNMDRFNDAMMGNTCMQNDNGELVNYHCDVLTALRCGIEDRQMRMSEFD